MKEKIKFKVSVSGKLVKMISCPLGTYYVDMRGLYYFEPANDEHEETISTVIAAILSAKGNKNARLIGKLITDFARLDKDEVKKEGDEYSYEASIDGELSKFVASPYGTMYGSHELKAFCFIPKHKGFVGPIEREYFVKGLDAQMKDEDEQVRVSAKIVKETILPNWLELSEENIVDE